MRNFIYLSSFTLVFIMSVTCSYATASYNPNSTRLSYFGANLAQFPPSIRVWIIEKAFPEEKMEAEWMKNSKLNAWWSEDGNSVLFEASYTIKHGYKGAGLHKTWGEKARYDGPDLWRYGKHAKYHSLKFKYHLKKETDRLIKSDPAYAEVAILARYLSGELEYDWSLYPDYKGATPIKTPNMKHAICVGYSKEVVKKALALKHVVSVEEWNSSEHIWNVLNLVDGRKLYLDLTWFDNETIDPKTGMMEKIDDYNWSNLTFDPIVFKYSNMSYSGTYDHAEGVFRRIYK